VLFHVCADVAPDRDRLGDGERSTSRHPGKLAPARMDDALAPAPGATRMSSDGETRGLCSLGSRVVRWLTLGGIAGPVLFVIALIVCGSLRPDYSHVSQFISELGAVGTPNAAWMNFAGFVPAGLLIAGFGASLAFLLPPGPGSRGIAALVGLFGLGTAVAGLAHCEPGCPQDQPTLHDGVSVAAFVSAIVASALAARVFRRLPAWRSLSAYSAVSSVAAACLLVALFTSIGSSSSTGLWQRLLVGTLFLWCSVVSVRTFQATADPTSASGGGG
jgi:hypothetical membrane protein